MPRGATGLLFFGGRAANGVRSTDHVTELTSLDDLRAFTGPAAAVAAEAEATTMVAAAAEAASPAVQPAPASVLPAATTSAQQTAAAAATATVAVAAAPPPPRLRVVQVAATNSGASVHMYPALLALARGFAGTTVSFGRLMLPRAEPAPLGDVSRSAGDVAVVAASGPQQQQQVQQAQPGRNVDQQGVDVEDAGRALKVVQVPTFLLFRDGQEVGRYIGSHRPDLVGQVLRLQEEAGVVVAPPPAPAKAAGGRTRVQRRGAARTAPPAQPAALPVPLPQPVPAVAPIHREVEVPRVSAAPAAPVAVSSEAVAASKAEAMLRAAATFRGALPALATVITRGMPLVRGSPWIGTHQCCAAHAQPMVSQRFSFCDKSLPCPARRCADLMCATVVSCPTHTPNTQTLFGPAAVRAGPQGTRRSSRHLARGLMHLQVGKPSTARARTAPLSRMLCAPPAKRVYTQNAVGTSSPCVANWPAIEFLLSRLTCPMFCNALRCCPACSELRPSQRRRGLARGPHHREVGLAVVRSRPGCPGAYAGGEPGCGQRPGPAPAVRGREGLGPSRHCSAGTAAVHRGPPDRRLLPRRGRQRLDRGGGGCG